MRSVNISDSSAGEQARLVPRQVRNTKVDIDSAFGARPGWKSSQGCANSRVSDPVYQDLKTRCKEPSGAASLALPVRRDPSGAASLAPAREPNRG
jgi:hypothetical protein